MQSPRHVSISTALLIAGVAQAMAQMAPDTTVMLQGGTIHTISGSVIENGSVLFRSGRIVGVGHNLAAPEGAQVIDVQGKQIYPGMIDSASFLSPEKGSADFIPASRANGVTSVVEMSEGDLLSGQISVIHLDGPMEGAVPVAPNVAIHLKFPAIETRSIPPHETADDDDEPTTAVEQPVVPYSEAKKAFQKKMSELNDFFDAARRYARRHAKPDARYEAMVPVIGGKQPIFVTAVREREIRDAIAFADRQKIKIILADPYEAWKVLPLIKSHNIPVVLGPTYSLPLNPDDPYDLSYTAPALLYKAGIKFSIGTFSARLTRNLPYQAAAAVPFGLPHDEAYKAVSLNAAEIFGLGNRLGSIDEGKAADLIVTDGDPMEATTNVTMVFIGGQAADLTTRQKQLYEKYRAKP